MVEIRRLERKDIPALVEIENACFSSPWSETAFDILFEGKNMGLVALVDGVVAAYIGLICVLDEGQITNIATHPDYRRRGLARALLSALDEYSLENGIVYLSLEVREKNCAARSLYESSGWQNAGVRKNFYVKPTDNAIVMIKNFER
ncbi:MAG: ribosomal protein S18-alanine N-acetyltransferase [Clostridia bacterium]|nr:ribosomal protein S18-alanine N-acetyltransferase [Clostridia bacterium]